MESSVLVSTLFLGACWYPSASDQETAKIVAEVDAVVRTITCIELRELAKQAKLDLLGTDFLRQRRAIEFFHDLRAEKLLLELLGPKQYRSGVLSLEQFDFIGFASLPRLYALLNGWYDDSTLGGSASLARLVSVSKLTDHVAVKLLRLKDTDIDGNPFDLEKLDGFRGKWLAMLDRACGKKPVRSALDDLIEAVQNVK